jgi:hypothetical protein
MDTTEIIEALKEGNYEIEANNNISYDCLIDSDGDFEFTIRRRTD